MWRHAFGSDLVSQATQKQAFALFLRNTKRSHFYAASYYTIFPHQSQGLFKIFSSFSTKRIHFSAFCILLASVSIVKVYKKLTANISKMPNIHLTKLAVYYII